MGSSAYPHYSLSLLLSQFVHSDEIDHAYLGHFLRRTHFIIDTPPYLPTLSQPGITAGLSLLLESDDYDEESLTVVVADVKDIAEMTPVQFQHALISNAIAEESDFLDYFSCFIYITLGF